MELSLKQVIEQVGKDKGLDKAIIIEALETAMLAAAKKRYGPHKDIEAHYNEEFGEIELFQFKEVVKEVKDPDREISLEEARRLDPEVEIGDSLGVKLDTSELGRIAAQTVKQIIIQKVREAERDMVYSEYKDKVGEVVTGIVQRFDKGDIIVTLGKGEAILPKREQVKSEVYHQGDRVRAYILEVERFAKGPQVVLSRTHPNFLIKLFELEVPEVYEKVVEIKGAAREPGERAKIAVTSHDPDVDPVGACVGMKGMRVQNVVRELKGEKIDIVPWDPDPARYVCNALAPAQVLKVIIDESEHSMEIIVPDDQLSLAIGKKGQNVRLAAKLTGWRIDVKSESQVKEELQEAKKLLSQIPGVGESMAPILYNYGFKTLEDIAKADIKTLMEVPGIGPESAEKIIEKARTFISTKEGPGIEAIPGVGEKTAEILGKEGYRTVADILNASEEDLAAINGIGEKKAKAIIEGAKRLCEESKAS